MFPSETGQSITNVDSAPRTPEIKPLGQDPLIAQVRLGPHEDWRLIMTIDSYNDSDVLLTLEKEVEEVPVPKIEWVLTHSTASKLHEIFERMDTNVYVKCPNASQMLYCGEVLDNGNGIDDFIWIAESMINLATALATMRSKEFEGVVDIVRF